MNNSAEMREYFRNGADMSDVTLAAGKQTL